MRYLVIVLLLFLESCSSGTGEQSWILAEELFHQGKYKESIRQFQKVVEADPKSEIGQRAFIRMAEIQNIYLSDYENSIKSYRHFILRSTDRDLILFSQEQIATIQFKKIGDYKGAIKSYEILLNYRPKLKNQDEILHQIGECYFRLLNFEKSLFFFKKQLEEYPDSAYAEETLFEISNVYFTKGDYSKAIEAYLEVIRRFPRGKFAVSARFGIASSYEEQDQLEKAYLLLKEIEDVYPNKEAIRTKMKHLLNRKISSKR